MERNRNPCPHADDILAGVGKKDKVTPNVRRCHVLQEKQSRKKRQAVEGEGGVCSFISSRQERPPEEMLRQALNAVEERAIEKSEENIQAEEVPVQRP